MDATPCMKCAESISPDATACPHCGFQPADIGKWKRKLCNALGCLCTLSIIGAPIAIVFFGIAWLSKREYGDAKPTTHSPP